MMYGTPGSGHSSRGYATALIFSPLNLTTVRGLGEVPVLLAVPVQQYRYRYFLGRRRSLSEAHSSQAKYRGYATAWRSSESPVLKKSISPTIYQEYNNTYPLWRLILYKISVQKIPCCV